MPIRADRVSDEAVNPVSGRGTSRHRGRRGANSGGTRSSETTYIPEAMSYSARSGRRLRSYDIDAASATDYRYESTPAGKEPTAENILTIDVPGRCLKALGLPEEIYPPNQNFSLKAVKVMDVLEQSFQDLSAELKKRSPKVNSDQIKNIYEVITRLLEAAYKYSEWLGRKQEQRLSEEEKQLFLNKKKYCQHAIEELCLIKSMYGEIGRNFSRSGRPAMNTEGSTGGQVLRFNKYALDTISLTNTRTCFNPYLPDAAPEQQTMIPDGVTVPVSALRCWSDTKKYTDNADGCNSVRIGYQEVADMIVRKLSAVQRVYAEGWDNNPEGGEILNAIICLLRALTIFCNQQSAQTLEAATPGSLPTDTEFLKNLYRLLESTTGLRDDLGSPNHCTAMNRLSASLKAFSDVLKSLEPEPQASQPAAVSEMEVTTSDQEVIVSGEEAIAPEQEVTTSDQEAGAPEPTPAEEAQPSCSGVTMPAAPTREEETAPAAVSQTTMPVNVLPEKEALCSIDHGLKVQMSRIPGAGNGLFADRRFEAEEFITWYGGSVTDLSQVVPEAQGGTEMSWCHRIRLDQNRFIQSSGTSASGEGGGGFINDGINIFLPPNVKAVSFPQQDRVYIKALRPIKKGEELLMTYDRDHWEAFKQQFPDQYSGLIAPQICSRETVEALLGPGSIPRRMKPVVLGLHSIPLPAMPEWQGDRSRWTAENVRYAIFKAGIRDGKILNLQTIRQIACDSDEYFKALGHYAITMTAKKGMIAHDWNGDARREAVPLPGNGVFKPCEKWTVGHLEVFARLFKPECASKQPEVRFCLNVLDPASSVYEDTLECYVKMAADLTSGVTLDMENADDRDIRKKLSKCLAGLPLPINYKGAPFRSAEGASSSRSNWTLPDIYRLLEASGIVVHRYDRRSVGRVYQLQQSMVVAAGEGEGDYFQKLRTWCQNEDFNFSRVGALIRRSCAQQKSGKGGAGRDFSAFTLRAVEGLNLEGQEFSATGIFLQYVEHFGFDDPGLLQRLNGTILYSALDRFEQPIAPESPLQTLYYQLFALAWADLSDESSAKIQLQRHPSLTLPSAVADMSFNEAFEALRREGCDLKRRIRTGNMPDRALTFSGELEPLFPELEEPLLPELDVPESHQQSSS